MALTLTFRPPERGPGQTPDAGVPAHCYEPGRGKKSGIKCEETGKRFGKTNVSAGAPDFFHQAVRDNQDYFEKRGQIEKITLNRDDPNNLKPRGAGLTSAERTRAAALLCGSKKHDIKNESTGEVMGQTICSAKSPRSFHTALENNRPFYSNHVSDRQVREITEREYNCLGNVKKKKIFNETGQVCSNALCSSTSPDWMKMVIADNQDFYDAGPRYFQPDEYAEFPVGKKTVFTTTEKGDPCNIYILSKASPKWMRSPLLSNKPYFETLAKGDFQECQVKYKNPWVGKRQHFPDPDTKVVSHRGNKCSYEDVPDWMNSPHSPRSPNSQKHFHDRSYERHPDRYGQERKYATARWQALEHPASSQASSQVASPTSSKGFAASGRRSGRADPDSRAARGSETERGRMRRTQTERPRGAETERGRTRR